MQQIFISYAREDYETAKRLYDDLKKRGLNPWMDKEKLLIGQNWRVTIREAIRKSSHFVALLSSRSVSKRGFVQKELKTALELLDEMPESEIFILPLLLDDQCGFPEGKLADIHCGELFPSYEAGLAQMLRVFMPEMADQQGSADDAAPLMTKEASDILQASPAPKYHLRSEPKKLSPEDIQAMLKAHNFFSKKYGWTDWHNESGYFENDFADNGDGTVSDQATGLMWQKSGSEDWIKLRDRQAYIEKLNQEIFAGYDDWRLPTIEELASLLENEKKNGDLYIDPVFDNCQWWCWSADERDSGVAWCAGFNVGYVNCFSVDLDYYVRAVRS